MEKKQTAVQWLFKNARLNMSVYDWLLCIEYAEKMEKEQIVNAYWASYKEGQYSGDKTAEEYYNEQYGK
jgi:hypothetical protein